MEKKSQSQYNTLQLNLLSITSLDKVNSNVNVKPQTADVSLN